MVSRKFKKLLKLNLFAHIAATLLLNSCAQVSNQRKVDDINPPLNAKVTFSKDSVKAKIVTDANFLNFQEALVKVKTPLLPEYFLKDLYPNIHDSTLTQHSKVLSENIPSSLFVRTLTDYLEGEELLQFTFQIDTAYLFPLIKNKINKYAKTEYAHPMFNTDPVIPKFDELIPNTKLLLPIDGLRFPSRASRLPNAPRSYRSGIHRGIDFFSNWGTPVRAVAEGIIIRSDLSYKEVSPDFRKEMLKRAAILGRTPSDIFNELLLGQAVIIDHGFKLFSDYRAITIYAHLSSINSNIKPGYIIKAGEIFAMSGNSGTEPSTLGTRNESHLHWELILQDAGGEYYFGRDLDYETLIIALDRIFEN